MREIKIGDSVRRPMGRRIGIVEFINERTGFVYFRFPGNKGSMEREIPPNVVLAESRCETGCHPGISSPSVLAAGVRRATLPIALSGVTGGRSVLSAADESLSHWFAALNEAEP